MWGHPGHLSTFGQRATTCNKHTSLYPPSASALVHLQNFQRAKTDSEFVPCQNRPAATRQAKKAKVLHCLFELFTLTHRPVWPSNCLISTKNLRDIQNHSDSTDQDFSLVNVLKCTFSSFLVAQLFAAKNALEAWGCIRLVRTHCPNWVRASTNCPAHLTITAFYSVPLGHTGKGKGTG